MGGEMGWKRVLFAIVISLGIVVACAGCAPRSDATDRRDDAVPVEFVWSSTADCSVCHDKAVSSFDDPSCLASEHADMKDACLTCHDDEAGLDKAHAKVTLDSEKKSEKLKKTKVESTVCLSCHDKEEAASKTADLTVLTDEDGTVVNPHVLPSSESHDSLLCSDCHKTHSSDPIEEVAQSVCKNCHHENVYECGTCHN